MDSPNTHSEINILVTGNLLTEQNVTVASFKDSLEGPVETDNMIEEFRLDEPTMPLVEKVVEPAAAALHRDLRSLSVARVRAADVVERH